MMAEKLQLSGPQLQWDNVMVLLEIAAQASEQDASQQVLPDP